jgi:serine/threonine protein kinase
MKMLPLNTKNAHELNQKEITIACEASQLVLETTSPHFPIVYDFGKCETFRGHKYKEVSAHFLISERASCDLYQYLTNKFPSKERIQEIKKQCLQAIHDMHKHLGVCHNDLHLRNFLVMENDKQEVLILIHDFGKAEYRKSYLQLDFEFFEKEFQEFE